MKNRKIIIGCTVAVIAAIVIFFIAYSGNRGVGTYVSQSYSGCYDVPDQTKASLIATAQPGEILQITHVSKSGWATVDYPGHGKLYTNFFALKADKVTYPVEAKNFYQGSEALLLFFQYLLWGMFIIAGATLMSILSGKEKPIAITVALLIATEIAYAVIYFAYISPADVLIETAFEKPLSVVFAFIANMAGLVLLGFVHIKLIVLGYTEAKAPNQSMKMKVISWAVMIFITLFTLYIALKLITMALIVAVIVLGVVIAFAVFSFIIDYERSHVTLTKDPYSGKWTSGNDEYDVNEAAGTARKKKFFDL